MGLHRLNEMGRLWRQLNETYVQHFAAQISPFGFIFWPGPTLFSFKINISFSLSQAGVDIGKNVQIKINSFRFLSQKNNIKNKMKKADAKSTPSYLSGVVYIGFGL